MPRFGLLVAPVTSICTLATMPASSRLPWIDHLRTFAIFLVVLMHSCVTYSHVGSWYVMSEKEPSLNAKIPFFFLQGHMQAFFMGLLFFLAGYFAHFSLVRRSPVAFFRERLFRLGLPTLFFMLVIQPFIVLGLNPWHSELPSVLAFYARYLSTGRFLSASGPLWFAFALLLFCTALAAWRAVRPAPAAAETAAPSAIQLWLFGGLLVTSTFLIRLVQPMGTNVMNFQLGYFPQYIAAFIAGLAAARHGWLVPLTVSPRARRAGWLALIGGPVALSIVIVASLPPPASGPNPINGGWHWPALGLAAWEQLAGLGLGLGLLALFHAKFNHDTPALRWFGDRAFAVYVFHTPVLIALTMAYRPLEATVTPLLLAALLAVTGLIGSFVIADLARRTPGLRAIV